MHFIPVRDYPITVKNVKGTIFYTFLTDEQAIVTKKPDYIGDCNFRSGSEFISYEISRMILNSDEYVLCSHREHDKARGEILLMVNTHIAMALKVKDSIEDEDDSFQRKSA